MRDFTIQFGRQYAARVAIGIAAMLTFSGCIFKEVREQQAKADAFCTLSGTVATARASERPLIVGLARHAGGDMNAVQNWTLADHFVLEEAGRWVFRASPSTYALV